MLVKMLMGVMLVGGLMAQQFGTKVVSPENPDIVWINSGVIDKSAVSGALMPLGQNSVVYKPQPGVIDCRTVSGRWTVAFRDYREDLQWLQGGVLVQPVDSAEVRMSKKFLPYAQMIECDISVVDERY